MNIAVTAEGDNLNSIVAEQFESCQYLLIVNMNDFNVIAIKNEFDDLGTKLAGEIVKYDCEAVITGKLKPETFDIIADACITRYLGTGYPAKNALDLMQRYQLKHIKNYEGTDECNGDHHHG